MRALRSIFDGLWAALLSFTRLPLWRLRRPGAEAFGRAAGYWPFAGWLTGGAMALVFVPGRGLFGAPVAALLAVAARALLTGAYHEDGLADFADGMGGGAGREGVLRIMKDSHIGTYGALALALHLMLLVCCMCGIGGGWGAPPRAAGGACGCTALEAGALVFTADVWGKCCASLLVARLPYARRADQAKAGLVYRRLRWLTHLPRVAAAMLPAALLWWLAGAVPPWPALALPLAVEWLLSSWLRRSIGGYTGDCCGAAFLLCELSVYLAFLAAGRCWGL